MIDDYRGKSFLSDPYHNILLIIICNIFSGFGLQENVKILEKRAVAYINADSSVEGKTFLYLPKSVLGKYSICKIYDVAVMLKSLEPPVINYSFRIF